MPAPRIITHGQARLPSTYHKVAEFTYAEKNEGGFRAVALFMSQVYGEAPMCFTVSNHGREEGKVTDAPFGTFRILVERFLKKLPDL